MSETRELSASRRGRIDGVELDFERCYRAVDSRDPRVYWDVPSLRCGAEIQANRASMSDTVFLWRFGR